MQPIKPVGLCPRCRATTRVPGRSYCPACQVIVAREQQQVKRRQLSARRRAGAQA